MPTRGSKGRVFGEERVFATKALESVINRSTYVNLEFVVVVDDGTDEEVVNMLRAVCGSRLRMVSYRQPFDYSHKVNLGVIAATGEYIVLLNDDVEVITPGWIEILLALVREPGVGIAGCLLYFEDGTIQHMGHIYGNGVAEHIARGHSADTVGPDSALLEDRECSGVTAACAMLSRSDYLAVGGMSREFPYSFNDVDLCLKIRDLGKRIVFTPRAKLYHFESKSRERMDSRRELDLLRPRWGRHLEGADPYWR